MGNHYLRPKGRRSMMRYASQNAFLSPSVLLSFLQHRLLTSVKFLDRDTAQQAVWLKAGDRNEFHNWIWSINYNSSLQGTVGATLQLCDSRQWFYGPCHGMRFLTALVPSWWFESTHNNRHGMVWVWKDIRPSYVVDWTRTKGWVHVIAIEVKTGYPARNGTIPCYTIPVPY